MESKYGCGKYTFFRNGRSTQELIEDFKKIKENPLDKHTQTEYQTNLFQDSCDIYSICGE